MSQSASVRPLLLAKSRTESTFDEIPVMYVQTFTFAGSVYAKVTFVSCVACPETYAVCTALIRSRKEPSQTVYAMLALMSASSTVTNICFLGFVKIPKRLA